MRVMVCGGRNYRNRAHVFERLDRLRAEVGIEEIVHGACGWDADRPETQFPNGLTGADRWADEWARERGVPFIRDPAHWMLFSKAAGPIRNKHALDTYKPDALMFFPGGRGTEGTIALARSMGVRILEEGGQKS